MAATVTSTDIKSGTMEAEQSNRVSTNVSIGNSKIQNSRPIRLDEPDRLCVSNTINNVSIQPKRKNARKKGKLKKLHIPEPNIAQIGSTNLNLNRTKEKIKVVPSTSSFKPENRISGETIQNTNRIVEGNNISGNFHNLNITSPQTPRELNTQSSSSVHDFFLRQVVPLYPSTNARYVENLAFHPQFQVAQNVISNVGHNMHSPQMLYTPLTPLNSPIIHRNQTFTGSSPNSSYLQSPKYFQNVIQHPLLKHSLLSHSQVNNIRENVFLGAHNAQHSNIETHKKKPNRKNKDTKDTNIKVKKFEEYISKEAMEVGLLQNTLIQGTIRINPKQFQHAYVTGSDRSEQDILIDSVKDRNRALEGDVVVVQMVDCDSEEVKQKKGKVVYIKEKVHTRLCIGTLMLMSDKNRQKALFNPRDYRIPRLNISCTYWPDNFYIDPKKYENTLFQAKILDWFDTRFAIGKIECNIGAIGDMQTEMKAILAQTDLDVTPFGPEVKHLFPSLDFVIPEEEIKLREDCRRLCIFSIDPYNCRDIDDAVSCRKLVNGNFEIGVHISDVSHFLAENNILDEKVAKKATTIYLVEKAYHMLPDELCMLCSLFPGVDKLAFSVFWEVTDDAQIVTTRFSKTVIHSCCQLAYEHAQTVLEGKDHAKQTFPEIYNGFQFSDVADTIRNLGKISSILRKRRFEGGALKIDQPKVAFNLSPINGLPESFCIYESKESHQLIEEYMLLANMAVAKKIFEDHPKLAFLRCHPKPSSYMLRQLQKALTPMDIYLEIESAGDLYKSLLPHVTSDQDNGKALVLSMLCAKPMARAKYFCAGGCEKDFHHYALNVPLYTHFTSPIRRYADIMVHRLLSASIHFRATPTWDINYVNMVAYQCNKQKYNAKRANELSVELYTLKYIELHSPVFTDAVVVEVKKKYVDVIIVAMGLNRKIYFNNAFPGVYNYISNEARPKLSKMELKWKPTEALPEVTQVLGVFSTVHVQMQKTEHFHKVEVKIVRPQSVLPTV